MDNFSQNHSFYYYFKCKYWFDGFDLNNNVFGIVGGRETLDTTLPRILRITEVEHKISNGEFSTSIKAFPTGQVPRKYINQAGEVIGEFERPGVATKSTKKKNKGKKKPTTKTGSNAQAAWDKKKQKKEMELARAKAAKGG